MRLALWYCCLHGMRANLLWYFGRDPDGVVIAQGKQWFDNSLLDQPWLLHGYVTAALNLRRFVPEVSAFARQQRQVRILYSEASAIQDVHAIDALRDTYEALNFLGVHIGFVTERELSAGWLRGQAAHQTRLIIVPNATHVTDKTVQQLQAGAARGISVRIIGRDSLTKDPVGKGHKTPIITGAKTIARAAAPPQYHLEMNRWLKQAGIARDVIACDQRAVPAWGVEIRVARLGSRRLVYLINLLRPPFTIRLAWIGTSHRVRDLRTGKPAPNPMILQPRQVILGEY